ncbi:hypothetical protein MKW92_006504 [Papaver armeniacum]|nr:hypothetical protein MKW92_006504 [Papaver armeniacum]
MEGGREVKWIKHYSSSHEILLVGEGDFSFSTRLARTFGSARHMVATSLDSEFLRLYSNAISNMNELRSRGCTVMLNIDARTMAQDSTLSQRKFDRIVFNFPYQNVKKRGSRSAQLSLHRDFVKLFFENATKLLAVNGQIHVTHKTNSFHCEWDLQGFSLSDYPGYNNKYGVVSKVMDASFQCQPSSTFKFGHA